MITNDLATLIGNNIFVATEITFICYLLYWLYSSRNEKTDLVLIAWLLVGFAILIRIGYWSIAIATHDPDPSFYKCSLDMINCELAKTVYPEWSTSWRGLATTVSSVLALIGQILFISYIQNFSFIQKYTVGVGVVSISIFSAVFTL